MGCFLGGIHDSSRKLLCPFYIWLPSPSTSAGLTRQTNPRPGPQHLGPDTAEAAHSPEGRHLYWAADLTGTINGDPESVASLHWDRGALLGVLQYRGAELHLQPLEGGALNSAGGPGAHILRRKSPASNRGPICNVKAPSGSPSPISRRTKVGNPGDPFSYPPPAMSVLLTPIHPLSSHFHLYLSSFSPSLCFPYLRHPFFGKSWLLPASVLCFTLRIP